MSTTRTQLATGRVSRTRKTPALWRWDCDCEACGFAGTGLAAQHNLNAHLAHACPRTQSARDRGVDLTPPPVTDPAVLAALDGPCAMGVPPVSSPSCLRASVPPCLPTAEGT